MDASEEQSLTQEIHAERHAFNAGQNLTINNYHWNHRGHQKPRKSNATHLATWKKSLILAGCAVTVFAAIDHTAIAINPSQGPVLSHREPPTGSLAKTAPSLGALSIVESRTNFTFKVPIFNPRPMDEQVQEVSISIIWGACAGTNSSAPVEGFSYILNGVFDVLTPNASGRTPSVNVQAPSVVEGVVTPEVDVGGEGAIRAEGSLVKLDCRGEYDLQFSFRPPALILEGQSTAPISVVIPEHLKAIPVFRSVKAKAYNVQIPDFLTDPYAVITAKITIKDDFGAQTSMCTISTYNIC